MLGTDSGGKPRWDASQSSGLLPLPPHSARLPVTRPRLWPSDPPSVLAPRTSPAHTRQLCSQGAGLICRKKRKLEKQNSLEYMDQNDDRLKAEGELPATHSPVPSSLRSVSCWEKAEMGDKEASSAGPLPAPTARRLQSRERSGQGRTSGIPDHLVEAGFPMALPGHQEAKSVGAGWWKGFCTWASHPILCSVQQTPSHGVESRSGRTPWHSTS